MTTKILIVGGGGFIGTNLALKLYQKNYSITILDNFSSQVHGDSCLSLKFLAGFTEFIKGDIRNPKDCEQALKNQDIVIHLAADTGTGQSMYQIEKYVDVNIRGTAILLERIVEGNHSIKKLVLASSRAVYGEGKYFCSEHGNVYPKNRKKIDMLKGDFEVKCPLCNQTVAWILTDESSILNPSSIYGITKQNQEQLVKTVCENIGVPSVIFRYQNVYGSGQSLSNPYTGILSIFSTRMRNSHAINIFEDGKQFRDFVYVDDVVDATILGIENEAANNQIFNVGSGEATSILEVAKILKEKYDLDIEIKITGNFRVGDIRHNLANLFQIKHKLNFNPKYCFKEGISKFVDWVMSQEIPGDRYEQSIEELRERGMFQ